MATPPYEQLPRDVESQASATHGPSLWQHIWDECV
jgi:hypothetical protein